MCLNPKVIEKKGFYKENNYRGKEGDYYSFITFAKCGYCEQCIAEKSNNWVVRNHYEQQAHEKKAFITLTYAENPIILVKKDLQDFLKRLRIKLDRAGLPKIRFFGNGEYGILNNRPHKHLIIYGWTDEHAKYLGLNKKHNLIFQSKIIQDTWGLGRTTIQEFCNYEIPYISLYTTPQEEFARAYKLSLSKLNKIKKKAIENLRMPNEQRKNLLTTLEEYEKELEEEKGKYKLVKEYNTWSKSLGWEEFFKEFKRNEKDYPFKEYIEDKEFSTPTPWVKKLANMGYKSASEEMFKREEMNKKEGELDERKERIEQMSKVLSRKKEEILKWNEQKTGLEEF